MHPRSGNSALVQRLLIRKKSALASRFHVSNHPSNFMMATSMQQQKQTSHQPIQWYSSSSRLGKKGNPDSLFGDFIGKGSSMTDTPRKPVFGVGDTDPETLQPSLPGSRAFVDCDRAAVIDLFHQYAVTSNGTKDKYLDRQGLASILKAVGENPDAETLERLYLNADADGNGMIELDVRMIIPESLWIGIQVYFSGKIHR